MRVRFRTIIGAIGGATLAASVAWAATTTLTLGTANGPGGIVVLEGATSGSVTVQPPAVAGATTFTLPGNNGSNTNVLQTDGSGNTSWVASGGGTSGNPTATAGPTAVNGSASTFLRSDGAPAIQKGTNAQFGIVEGDGSTITCVAGVCTAIGGSATSVVPGTTTVGGATAPCLIDNSTGTTMGCAAMGAGLNLSGGALTPAGRTAVGNTDCGTLTNATTLVGFTTVLSAARSCTFPAANTFLAGQKLCFVDEGDGTNPAINGSFTVTLNRTSSDKINGATSFVMGVGYAAACFESDASAKWSTVSNQNIGAQAATSNNFLTGIGSDGVFTRAQPAFTNISGTATVAQGGTGLTSGTSGGVLAYTASGTLASSGALTANLPVIGGGAGVAPTVGTRSGNTTAYVTTTGSQTSGDCVKIDASGNHVANGSACGGGAGITCESGSFTVSNATCVWSQTASGSAEKLEFTGLTKDNYDLDCFGIQLASGTNNLGVQLGSGSTTWNTTANYVSNSFFYGVGFSPSNNSSATLAALNIYQNAPTSTEFMNLTLHCVGLSQASVRKMCVGEFGNSGAAAIHFNASWTGDGNAITAIRLIDTTGTPVNLKNTTKCVLRSL